MKKTINWKEEFTKLFPETTVRELKPNHIWCDKCNGISFIKNGNYISSCTKCHGEGQIELCTEGCGRLKYSYYYTVCKECKDKKQEEIEFRKEKEAFEKATKISFNDYDGMFLDNERAIDKEEFEENLYYKILEDDNYPDYVYGTRKQHVINIDFKDIIYNACEDGYEDMDSFLDYKGVDEIQNKIDEWIDKQGDANYIYYEDYKTVVLLNDLITEIKEQIEKERNR